MKRAALSAMYLAVGLFVSWQSALFASRLAARYSWPLVNTRERVCWDVGHCQVAWWAYVVIAVFVFGPAAAWAFIGFFQARRFTLPHCLAAIATLTIGTAFFYFCFYAFVWP
jgi:hypothetical protein